MDSVQGTLLRLLDSGEYSDASILSEGVTFSIHRNIVCFQSPYFDSALRRGFEESSSGTVVLDESKPSFIRRMLEYLYSHDYSDECEYDTRDVDNNEYDATTCQEEPVDEKDIIDKEDGILRSESIADKDISLETTTLKKTEGVLGLCWIHSAMYSHGDRFQIPGLKQGSLEKFRRACEDNTGSAIDAEVVRQVYEGTPDSDRSMRDALVDAVCQSSSLHGLEQFARALEASHDFAKDVALGLLRKQKQTAQPTW